MILIFCTCFIDTRCTSQVYKNAHSVIGNGRHVQKMRIMSDFALQFLM